VVAIIYTSHCCPRFAAGDVLGIGKILKKMAHMSNMFYHHVATKGWSILIDMYIRKVYIRQVYILYD